MNKTYAVIYNRVVENFVTTDLPVEEIEKLPERQLVEVPNDHEMGAGFTFDGVDFTPPIQPQTNNQDVSQLLVTLVNNLDENQRNSLLQILSGNSLPSDEPPLPQTTL